MLRTNLATRPFYNERAVRFVLGILVLAVLAVSAFNAIELLRLTESQRTLGAHAFDAEREAARLRSEAAAIRAQINAKELEVVANAAREANSIIDQRAFSWSELFDQLEHTLPDDVRITAVDPALTPQGQFIVNIATPDVCQWDFAAHVFDRFYKVDASRAGTRVPSGSGLGLSIVRAIVARHGGEVHASNRPEGGAVFTFLLPSTASAR